MNHAFALDLKVARHKSGLAQRDCAHLLDVNRNRISSLELGKTMPTVPEICALSLVYGKSFESLFEPVMRDMRNELGIRLETLPPMPNGWRGHFNRNNTLNRIAAHLEAIDAHDRGAR